jgi:hypothetical protein
MSWDARFFIAIFSDGTWCKVHAFSGGKHAGLHCTSALEALDGAPQHVAMIGGRERVERREDRASFEGSVVRASGVEASIDARDRFFWIRVPRVLSYWSATGRARVSIDGKTRDAFGVIEHAWGGETRLDVAALAPKRWQWDVLHIGSSPGDRFCAGLALHGFGAHGVARLEDGRGTTRVNRLRIEAKEPGKTWSGALVTRSGTLRYDARAVTPVLPEVPGGGFVGFVWDGTLRGERVSGAGFSEFRATMKS